MSKKSNAIEVPLLYAALDAIGGMTDEDIAMAMREMSPQAAEAKANIKRLRKLEAERINRKAADFRRLLSEAKQYRITARKIAEFAGISEFEVSRIKTPGNRECTLEKIATMTDVVNILIKKRIADDTTNK